MALQQIVSRFATTYHSPFIILTVRLFVAFCRKFGIKSRFLSDIFWLFLQFSNNVFMILMMSFGTFATLIIIRKKERTISLDAFNTLRNIVLFHF